MALPTQKIEKKPPQPVEAEAAPHPEEEGGLQNHTIPPMTMKTLTQMVAEYARNRETKECKRQASLENFASDLDKFMQEMKEEYDQSRVPGENSKPMNYEIF